MGKYTRRVEVGLDEFQMLICGVMDLIQAIESAGETVVYEGDIAVVEEALKGVNAQYFLQIKSNDQKMNEWLRCHIQNDPDVPVGAGPVEGDPYHDSRACDDCGCLPCECKNICAHCGHVGLFHFYFGGCPQCDCESDSVPPME